MKLPNSEAAVVEQKKIVGYLLNANHPDGSAKARFFHNCGFDCDRWQVLADALRRMAQQSPVIEVLESPHGEKYIVDGPIETPNGRSPFVRSVWTIDRGYDAPRLITASPRREGTSDAQ